MRASGLRGMSVVTIEGAEIVGKVEDLVLDLETQRIVALRLGTASAEAPEIVPVDRIHGIGRDAVTLEGAPTGQPGGPAPEESRADTDVIDTLEELLGARVLSYSGNHLGTVADVEFDPGTFQITDYELKTGGISDLMGSRRKLPAGPGIHSGRGILTVPEEEHVAPAGREEPARSGGEKSEKGRASGRPRGH